MSIHYDIKYSKVIISTKLIFHELNRIINSLQKESKVYIKIFRG